MDGFIPNSRNNIVCLHNFWSFVVGEQLADTKRNKGTEEAHIHGLLATLKKRRSYWHHLTQG